MITLHRGLLCVLISTLLLTAGLVWFGIHRVSTHAQALKSRAPTIHAAPGTHHKGDAFVGMKLAEVEKILGKPISESDSTRVYHMGTEWSPLFGPEAIQLEASFSSAGIVTGAFRTDH